MSVSVAVIGGGISGLVAAYRLRCSLGPDADISIVETSSRLGGKLRTVDLGSGPVDIGAEAFIARRPEVPALLAELGLSDQIVYPAGLSPLIWSQGSLHRLPAGTLMGIPAGGDAVAGLVSSDTLSRISAERSVPFHWECGSDCSVAHLVSERFGDQVVRRSVDPLLGGVYSGLAETIGVRAALPTLAAALDAGATSLSDAVAAALPTPAPGPVFGALKDGYGVLLDALLGASGAKVITAAASGLRREGTRWFVDPIGTVDAVILAVPAPAAAALLADVAPVAARTAEEIRLASSAVVALRFAGDIDLPQNSGILVATDADLTAKAFTLSSRKWTHLAQRGDHLVRASFGRFGAAEIVESSDAELIALAREDLSTVTGITDEPTVAFVQRWHGGLPQYAPGHTAMVAEIEHGVAELAGVEVAGSWLHGVGVPACVAVAQTAAARICEGVAP
ncbi:protoporphyrinogen oxidase [Rhodococcus sp. ARC_M6]|uniref:protoporphyrinogen oxidase n=1 Tax=Rhodococcus sp. ARC_M6 TaxID=2928852 RepID=UPI001FB3B64E|nr:protoporphyrinogen oxidase [Rhodococcus sp. ARC_M6]MCJ0902621.1 protoporphyrinogen oxidase [Rhodococcus sp. ARC_M6]